MYINRFDILSAQSSIYVSFCAPYIKDAHETDEWTSFSLNFDYDSFGKGVDAQKLAEGKYSLGIVMASSKDGASFEGAPGSTLLIDEMELIFE